MDTPDYESLACSVGCETEIFDFASLDEVVTAELETGSQVQITYDPERIIVMTFLGVRHFEEYIVLGQMPTRGLKRMIE